MDVMLEVLEGAGFGEAEARRAYGAIHTYTIGFAALEASRGESVGERDDTDRLRQELAKFTTPTQFKVGLELLLQGLRPSANS